MKISRMTPPALAGCGDAASAEQVEFGSSFPFNAKPAGSYGAQQMASWELGTPARPAIALAFARAFRP